MFEVMQFDEMPAGGDLRTGMMLLARHVDSAIAAVDVARACYDRAFLLVAPEQRKFWGQLFGLVQRWDDHAAMAESAALIDNLAGMLETAAGVGKPTNGERLTVCVAGMTLLALLWHAVRRRIGELAVAGQPAAAESPTNSTPAQPVLAGVTGGCGG